MAQTTINVGAAPNDGTGDPARTAFQAVNGNFTEVYGNLQTRQTALASAGTTSIGAVVGNFLHITGVVTITSLGTGTAGLERMVVFDGILTLTHNATSLILPTGANIVTAAGDTAQFVNEGTTNWRCTDYLRASGLDLAGPAAGLAGSTIGNYKFVERTLSATGGTIIAADSGTRIVCTQTGTATHTVSSAATLGTGFECEVVNDGTGVVTLDGPGGTNSAVAIDEVATIIVCNSKVRVCKGPSTVV